MTDDSRQQRRKLQRERLKAGQRGLAKGLAAAPGRNEVIAIAEVLRAKLTETGNDRRASEAAGLAHSLSERSLRAHPAKREIACKRGCAYCCHLFVGVLPPEAFLIADAIREGKAGTLDATTARARTVPLRGLSPAARVGARLPCPLLLDGMCSVYPVRPLVCRQTTSFSLAACLAEFEGRDGPDRIEASPAHLAHSSNAHVTLLGAMRAAGMPTEAYELSGILDVVLAEPDAERRWLAGEDVFRDLPRNVKRQREADFVAGRIAAELTAS
jgi:hypothetical protein